VSVALATTGVRDPRPGPGADRLETDVVAVEPGFLDPEHGERELSAIVSLWQSSPGGPLGKGARVASPARSCPPPASQSSLTSGGRHVGQGRPPPTTPTGMAALLVTNW
jgi:hypothetical protein